MSPHHGTIWIHIIWRKKIVFFPLMAAKKKKKEEKTTETKRDFSTVIRRSKSISYLAVCIAVKRTNRRKKSTVMNTQKTTNSHTIYIIYTGCVSVFSMVYPCIYTYNIHTPLYSDIANYCAFAQYATEKMGDERSLKKNHPPNCYDTIQITFFD